MRLNLTFDDAQPGRLQSLRQRLYVARSLVPHGYESYFQERARFWSAHTSTAIEGNPLTDQAAMLVLVEGEAGEPDEQEKVNLDEAYELIGLWAQEKQIRIDEGIIRGMNSMVLKGLPGRAAQSRGRYRLTTSAVVDAGTREVRYLPPPPEWVPELMARFAEDIALWVKDQPGPIAAALAHFGLISIHPFEDGNGRVARLLADLILSLTGSSADGMISVSGIIRGRLDAYYGALRAAQGRDFGEDVNVSPFIDFHNTALSDAAIDLEERAIRFSQHRDRLLESAHGVLNERQITGLMFMMDIGPLSSSTYARLTGSSQSSAQSDLLDLLRKEFAEKTGAGKNTRYRLSPPVRTDLERHGTADGGAAR